MMTPEKRSAPHTSTSINSLIAAANSHDRFKLMEDDNIQSPNLDNPIHDIFSWFDCKGPLKRMLQLSSQFLLHDSVLTFFVPLLYGCEITTSVDGKPKTYLLDPLASASPAKRAELLSGVRSALTCLSHSLDFQFMKPEKRVYARTLTSTSAPVPRHTPSCYQGFEQHLTARIEISDRFMNFYNEGYTTSSLCAQLRHDFLFATTLVHEIVHAVGVLRRGNLHEPFIRAEHPETEWGYAWEHFMFGSIFNPQDRTRPGTHLLMRKVWADAMSADDAGGKEYCDVSMAYIAKWFRKETWDVVRMEGPIAVPMPRTRFKIQSSVRLGAWIVSTDCIEIKPDIVKVYEQWQGQWRKVNADGIMKSAPCRIFWRLQSTQVLQRSNVRAPLRVPGVEMTCSMCPTCGQALSTDGKKMRDDDGRPPLEQASGSSSQKRKAISSIEVTRVTKKAKQ